MKYIVEGQQFPYCYSPNRRIKKSKHSKNNNSKLNLKSNGSCASPQSSPVASCHSKVSTASRNSSHYEFKIGEELGDGYKITRLLGDGTFGRVVQAHNNNKRYAIKIIRPVQKYIESAKIQRNILKTINQRDSNDQEGLVRYKNSFYYNGHYCLVFKPLGMSLYEVIKKNQYRGFPIKMVQSFFKQILKSLAFLHKIGYTHTDLKPQNILLQKQELVQDSSIQNYFLPKTTKIRIIDFGGATKHGEYHCPVICTRQYRPPEVILECCQWNEIADVWSVGCIIAQLFTGQLLFPTHSDYEHLVMMQKNSGKFPNWMINKTTNQMRKIFRDGQICQSEVDQYLQHWQNIRSMKSSGQIFGEHEHLADLISQCLQIDPNRRINCVNALRHSFFQQKFE